MSGDDRAVPRGRVRRTMPVAGFTARAAGGRRGRSGTLTRRGHTGRSRCRTRLWGSGTGAGARPATRRGCTGCDRADGRARGWSWPGTGAGNRYARVRWCARWSGSDAGVRAHVAGCQVGVAPADRCGRRALPGRRRRAGARLGSVVTGDGRHSVGRVAATEVPARPVLVGGHRSKLPSGPGG